VITYHFVIIFIETNDGGECRNQGLTYCEVPLWIRLSNVVLLLVYTVECGVRFYAFRLDFFGNKWNLLDLSVVVTGYVDVVLAEVIAAAGQSGDALPSLFFLRLFRIARMIRAFRLWFSVRELYLLLHGFMSSMKSIFWGSLIMMGLIVMWSIVLIEMIDPVNRKVDHGDRDFCKRAFSSVWLTSLYLFQTLMAGDSWGQCSRPIIEAEPWTFLLFFGALGTILMGFGNLILAVIVARAEEARQDDSAQKLKDKKVDEDRQKRQLVKIFNDIDLDNSGGLTLGELLDAYDHHEELGTMMRLMDVARDEMESIYRLLDVGQADHVATKDFVKNLYDMKNRDPRLTLTFIKYHVLETGRQIDEHIKFVRTDLMERLDTQDLILEDLYTSLLGRAPPLPESSVSRGRRRKTKEVNETSSQSISRSATPRSSPRSPRTSSLSMCNNSSLPMNGRESISDLKEWQGAKSCDRKVQDRWTRIAQEAEESLKKLISELAEVVVSTHVQASARIPRGDVHPSRADEEDTCMLPSAQFTSWQCSPPRQAHSPTLAVSQQAFPMPLPTVCAHSPAFAISQQAFPMPLPTVQPEEPFLSPHDVKPGLPEASVSYNTCLDRGVLRI